MLRAAIFRPVTRPRAVGIDPGVCGTEQSLLTHHASPPARLGPRLHTCLRPNLGCRNRCAGPLLAQRTCCRSDQTLTAAKSRAQNSSSGWPLLFPEAEVGECGPLAKGSCLPVLTFSPRRRPDVLAGISGQRLSLLPVVHYPGTLLVDSLDGDGVNNEH